MIQDEFKKIYRTTKDALCLPTAIVMYDWMFCTMNLFGSGNILFWESFGFFRTFCIRPFFVLGTFWCVEATLKDVLYAGLCNAQRDM